jgi:hypothetical protein
VSQKHPYCRMETTREALCLWESSPETYDRRLLGFKARTKGDNTPGVFSAVVYISCFGTTVPIALFSTARTLNEGDGWEVMIGRSSGVAPGAMAPYMFRVGHEGVDIPAGLTFALWMVGAPTSFPPIDIEPLWTYTKPK